MMAQNAKNPVTSPTGKILTTTANLTFGGTDDSTITFGTGGTVCYTATCGNGIDKLVSGSLGPSTSFVDIALPGGYVKFVLELQDIQADSADNLAYRLSSDGGGSFHTDAADYKNTWFSVPYGATSINTASTFGSGADSMGYLTFDNFDNRGDVGVSSMTTITIWPGSLHSYALVRSDSVDINNNANTGFPDASTFASALTGEKARQNFIRIAPYFGDSGVLISGSYILYGYTQ